MKYAIAGAILALAASGAVAQTTSPPASTSGSKPAVATSTTVNPSAPVAGANSFTEGQAKSRMEAAGYSGVSALMKDKDGVWHADASKAGKAYKVTLDYQGNVVPK